MYYKVLDMTLQSFWHTKNKSTVRDQDEDYKMSIVYALTVPHVVDLADVPGSYYPVLAGSLAGGDVCVGVGARVAGPRLPGSIPVQVTVRVTIGRAQTPPARSNTSKHP